MIHLLAYVPELRGKMEMIEEPIRVQNIELSLRTDGERVKAVYLAPSRTMLDFKEEGGYVHLTVPEVCGYQMVVCETA